MKFTSLFRPKTLENFLGQKDIILAFSKFLLAKKIPHSLFFGTPGSGKTSLAKIIAANLGSEFYEFDGANFKIDNLRQILKQNKLFTPLIFIDEFHRLSSTQQEALLLPVENDECLLFGATTENPKFSISGGLRSRMMIFEFKPLCDEELLTLINEIKTQQKIQIDDDAISYLIKTSNGDARSLLNLLEFASILDKKITLKNLQILRSNFVGAGVKSSNTHYELTSAFIKSLRGSDIDAGLYYLARLLVAGEDPVFLARRMVILASEDIANANPNALNLAVSTMQAVSKIGMPEARIILAQCVIYLACSPKSNSAYLAIDKAICIAQNCSEHKIPPQIINHTEENKNYLYPHDFGGWCAQEYLPQNLKNTTFYKSKLIGFEKTLFEWNTKIKHINS